MRTTICAIICALAGFIALPVAAQISGEVQYTGTASGMIHVEAFTEDDANFEKLLTSMINPGPFDFQMAADGTYTVIAYIDQNDNARLDGDEIWVGAATTVVVPPGRSGIALDLDTYKVPGEESADDDGGCCAVVGRDVSSSWALLAGLCALLWRRRSF